MPSLHNPRHRARSLNQDTIDQIRTLLSKDCTCCGLRPTQEQLARKFEVSRSTIAKISNNTL